MLVQQDVDFGGMGRYQLGAHLSPGIARGIVWVRTYNNWKKGYVPKTNNMDGKQYYSVDVCVDLISGGVGEGGPWGSGCCRRRRCPSCLCAPGSPRGNAGGLLLVVNAGKKIRKRVKQMKMGYRLCLHSSEITNSETILLNSKLNQTCIPFEENGLYQKCCRIPDWGLWGVATGSPAPALGNGPLLKRAMKIPVAVFHMSASIASILSVTTATAVPLAFQGIIYSVEYGRHVGLHPNLFVVLPQQKLVGKEIGRYLPSTNKWRFPEKKSSSKAKKNSEAVVRSDGSGDRPEGGVDGDEGGDDLREGVAGLGGDVGRRAGRRWPETPRMVCLCFFWGGAWG